MRIILGLILGPTVGLTLMIPLALSHDDADWIRQNSLRSKIGEFCCGEGDCKKLAPNDVSHVAGGYLIISTNEFVPQRDAMPVSPDGYWRCHRPDGTRRCFFVPPDGS